MYFDSKFLNASSERLLATLGVALILFLLIDNC